MSYTMFGPARYKYLSKVISLRSPAEARKSTYELGEAFFVASTGTKRLRIARATQLAANRARVLSNNRNISSKERAEYRQIAKIYNDTAKGMFMVYRGNK